ncbi:PAS domain-containing sensor histidine kinase [Desulfobacula sp.]|uniref:sensor histidine kinase n=1 Tax=Desulfobacula sp. TaxID=2593537 RepID=UPI002620878F|nr:PAS domain-containing sensor histidine kinase [Desulfobacula sp.]
MLKKMLTSMKSIWPEFQKHKQDVHLKSFYTFTDYWHLWTMSIFILVVTALSPLCIVTLIHYQLIQKSVDSELNLRTERLTSNAKRSTTFFMKERLDALIFTVNEMGYEQLTENDMLAEILKNLKLGFGGFSDLSVFDEDGAQVAYAGPFNIKGKNYKCQPWFLQSLKKKYFISEVFTGYRDVPHIIIAVKSIKPDKSFFILRATLDTERLMETLTSYKTGEHTDIFLVNHKGSLQTPSTNYGNIFTQTDLKIFNYSRTTEVSMATYQEVPVILGHSFISTDMVDTPFILVVQKKKAGLMHVWLKLRRNFNWTVGISVVLIVLVITFASTFMTNRLYLIDKAKAETMLQMEQNQQLASIGQLAAGVAHEINNPLAVINQTAGYVKDLYSFKDEPRSDAEIIENIDSILEAVDRCGTITQQLLGFVRQFDIKIKKINLQKLVSDVLSFHKKEAEYRGINVTVSIPDTIPDMETDSGKLQQILVNLINNAFQAVDEGCCLDIIGSQIDTKTIEIVIQDTGCGIPEDRLAKIHEPFFSTKQDQMGTGLGLSITYGLVKKLGGNISVQSTEGVGTCFTITLPVKIKEGELV